jgi:hypothetical protein
MPWGQFLRVKFGGLSRHLAVSRYAIRFALYSIFKCDPEPKATLTQSGQRFPQDKREEFARRSCSKNVELRQFDKRATDPY